MGCDIHGWVEKKDPKSGRWVAYKPLKDRTRNYHRFGLLAGVRGDGGNAIGVPENASDTVRMHIDEDGSDGHSHSYMDLQEAYGIFKDTSGKPDYSFWQAFDIDDEPKVCGECRRPLPVEENWRLVFWFDN